MNFIEFEQLSRPDDHSMPAPHTHDYYELYFLLDGERDFFVDNKMFVVPKNSIVIVPPYVMHKTEGGPYKRININVSSAYLTHAQNEFLMKASKKSALKISDEHLSLIVKLLEEGAKFPVKAKNHAESLIAIAQTIISFLSIQDPIAVETASATLRHENGSPEVLKIIYYINRNYTNQITLKELCDEFFMCKVSLCKKFKEVMHCSIMEYILQLRLNKAKALLREGNKSIEEIAGLCGFSSANYFGLIFKKVVGLSPLNYKKTR